MAMALDSSLPIVCCMSNVLFISSNHFIWLMFWQLEWLPLCIFCRSWTRLHCLSSSSNSSAVASALVCVLLLHGHLIGNWWTGQHNYFFYDNFKLCSKFYSCSVCIKLPLCCFIAVCRAWKQHDVFNRSLPFLPPKGIPPGASSVADLYC